MRILVIDHYDSFTYNLVQSLGELGAEPLVAQHDRITLKEASDLAPDGILLSPGPGRPEDLSSFGASTGILRTISPHLPTLGVCLGHQGIGHLFGARVRHAKRLCHGKTSRIHHAGEGLFYGLPDGFLAARYHSLALERGSIPGQLLVTAVADDGEVMGIRHRDHPIEGIQFHPESILTQFGKELIANFLSGVRRWHQDRGRSDR